MNTEQNIQPLGTEKISRLAAALTVKFMRSLKADSGNEKITDAALKPSHSGVI